MILKYGIQILKNERFDYFYQYSVELLNFETIKIQPYKWI
jgi:hypothetical protein